jgi:hypothetical protein
VDVLVLELARLDWLERENRLSRLELHRLPYLRAGLCRLLEAARKDAQRA